MNEAPPNPPTQPKTQTLVLMMVAVFCGLTAAFLASQLGNQAADAERGGTSGLVKVVVAAKDISAGTRIDSPSELFKVVHYRAGDQPQGTVADVESLKGKVVVRPLAEDQPVKERDVGQ